MHIRKSSFENKKFCVIILSFLIKNAFCAELQNWNRTANKQVAPLTCKLPLNKNFLIVKNAKNGREVVLGAEVAKDTPLLFSCESGYNLKGFNITICAAGGQWTRTLPSCISFCSDHHPRSGFSTKAYFELNSIDVSHARKFEPDTVAKISCADSFYKPADFENKLLCTEKGWRETKVPCLMECGQPVPMITPFSTRGNDAYITEVPWHVGVYEEKNGIHENICGGVLVSPRIVVSAAHCFFESKRPNAIMNFTRFIVAAGKYYRDLNSAREENSTAIEIRKVINIWIPDNYAGRNGYYLGDLAILRLTEFIPFSEAIRPVCLFKTNGLEDIVLTDRTGKLSTWSQVSVNEPHSVLKTLQMSAIEWEICNETLSKQLQQKLPVDKFCLVSYGRGAAACKGDSGSGFVIQLPNTNEYVLLGIVSFSPIPTRECTRHHLLVMTNVSFYQEVLEQFKKEDLEHDVDGYDKQLMNTFSEMERTCKVPANLDFMTMKHLFTGVIVEQGYNAPMQAPYFLACESGYVLNGNNIAICGPHGFWLDNFPKCIARQKSIATTSVAEVCRIPAAKRFLVVHDASNGDLIDLGGFVQKNKSLIFSCDGGHLLKGANSSICKGDDVWTENLPFCYFNCSDKHPKSGFSTKAFIDFEGDGLVAHISCAYFYGRPKDFHDKLTCTEKGWNAAKYACFMNCGRPEEPIRAQSKGAIKTNFTDAPWHASIYKKLEKNYVLICGGTLISPRFAVSATHCFFQAPNDRSTNSTNIDLSIFSIVAGNYYREYDKEASSIESRNIIEIWPTADNEAPQNGLRGDILIIKLDRFIAFSATIRPACLYLAVGIYQNIPSDIQGRVATWSPMSGGYAVRKTLHLKTLSYGECNETLAKQSSLSLSADQFCLVPTPQDEQERIQKEVNTGMENEATHGVETFACGVDSGSGFVARNPDGGFALFGVVSFSESSARDDCRHRNLIVMTNVLLYRKWLKEARDQDLKNDVDMESIEIK